MKTHGIQQRNLGDLKVSAIGIGAMPMTATFEVDPELAEQAVHAAIDAGITFFDTADAYGPSSEMGVNEKVLAAAMASYPGDKSNVIIGTKGGHFRGPDASWGVNGDPQYLASAAKESLRRLNLERFPLYQLHRPDPQVPYAESCSAIKTLIDEGVVERAGVSNVSLEQLEIARDILGPALVSVQNQYSPLTRTGEEVLRRCEELGIAFLSWGPLGGRGAAKNFGEEAPEFSAVAGELGVSPQQVGVAWLLARSPVLIPIPGASRPQSVRDTVQALEVAFDNDQLERLDRAVETY